MRTLPQELVDWIIDELADLNNYHAFGQHSLISRAWVTRTQRYCFERVNFEGLEELEKWQRNIEPDPAGVSRHVRKLVLTRITSLEAFDAHIRAFTRVEVLTIVDCSFVLSPLVAKYFAPMGSSLVQLLIKELETTSGTIISLLATLPKLKNYVSNQVKVMDNTDRADLTVRVPFFKGGNSALFYSHFDQWDPPGPPGWIPPSARFSDLRICITYLYKPGLFNQWLSNSSTNLTSLEIYGDLVALPLPDPFAPFDLSPCHSLERLCISVRLRAPGVIAEAVLPSIVSSPELSYVCLQAEAEEWDEEIDYPAWAATEGHLCRLVKFFSVQNPGEKMAIEIYGDCEPGPRENRFMERFGREEFLPKLKEEMVLFASNVPWYG